MKNLAAAPAILCITGAMAPSAADYDPCGVNHDGAVNSQHNSSESNSIVLMTKHHLMFYGSNPYISNES